MAQDAEGVGTDTAIVRSERSGPGPGEGEENSGYGNGRVYEITFIATDNKGAQSTGVVNVGAPHDYRQVNKNSPKRGANHSCDAIDDGQLYDATEINVQED